MSARAVKNISRVVIGDQEEKRLPISRETKKAVYTRAGKRCECCGMPLKINQGQFHHHRTPKIKPTPKTVQFLCATHHQMHGHEKKTRTKTVGFERIKETYILRKKVKKDQKSPYWKQKELLKERTSEARKAKTSKERSQSKKTIQKAKSSRKKRKRSVKSRSPLEKLADII